MKNTTALKWLFKNSKSQLPAMFFLILARCSITILGVVFALSSKTVIDAAVSHNIDALIHSSSVLLAIIFIQIIIRFVGQNIETKMNARLQIQFKNRLFGSLLKKDYTSITAYHSGDLMTRLSSDIGIVSNGILSLVPSVAALLAGLVYSLYALVRLDRNFAFIFLFGGIFVLLLVSAFRGISKKLHKNVQEAESSLRSFFQECLESLLMIKVFRLEKTINNKADNLQEISYGAQMKRKNLFIFASCGLNLVFSLGSLYSLIWGSFRIYNNTMTFGALTAILQLVNQIQGPFASMSGIVSQYYAILASTDRIIELENLPDEDSSLPELNSIDAYKKLECISFKDITFCYGREVIFENASIDIQKGDFVAISGISGIGKSTLLKLLLGVISPESGRIFLKLSNGEIDVSKSSRQLFSYVPQGNLLLSGTIRDSVSLVCPDATDEQIMSAAEISCAAEFITQLPKGLDTYIGEKGMGLSEGQIQRLAITRAILSDAPILLLDEATSALDEATEERLLKNIREMRGKTCIIISHKKAALNICNKQIYIADKKINVSNAF